MQECPLVKIDPVKQYFEEPLQAQSYKDNIKNMKFLHKNKSDKGFLQKYPEKAINQNE